MCKPQLRILILHTNEAARVALKSRLEGLSYLVDTVANGGEALCRVQQPGADYDVVVLHDSPAVEQDAIAILRDLKASCTDTECIVCTSRGSEISLLAAQEGAYRCLEEPSGEEIDRLVRQAGQHARLRKVSRIILSKRDLDEALDEIARAASSLTLADSACIVLVGEGAEKPQIYPSIPSTGVIWRRHFTDGKLALEIAQTGQAVLVADTGQDGRVEPRVRESGIRSFAGVPIPQGAGNLGVLFAYSHEPGHFSHGGQVAMLRTLAAQAGLAIANARDFQQLKRQVDNLDTLRGLAVEINSALPLRESLRAVCRAAVEFFGADHSGLVVLDPDGTRGHVAAEYPDQGALGLEIPLRGVAAEERLLDSREPLVIENVAQEDSLGPVQGILLKLGIQSILVVPVINKRGEFLGSFSLDAIGHSRHFSEEEVELCRMFAAQVAGAMEAQRLVDELQKAQEYIQALYEATVAIISSDLRGHELLQKMVDVAQNTTRLSRALILLPDGDGRFDVWLQSGFEPKAQPPNFRPDGVSRKVLVSSEACFYPSVKAAAGEVNPAMVEAGIQSAACIPLLVRGKAVGVLWLEYREPRTFPEPVKQALRAFANASAIAYEKDRQWQALDDLRRRLEQTRQAAGVVAEAMTLEDLQATLDTIVRHVRRVFASDAVTIYSYDEDKGQFGPWAADIAEPRKPGSASPPDKLREGSPLLTLLHMQGEHTYYYVEDGAQEDPLLKGGFTQSEGISATFGIQLWAAEHKVGVMFVNYRSPHPFSPDEIATVELFANQAAVAIRNAQLYERSERRARTLAALSEAGQAVTSSLGRDEILARIAEQAWKLSSAHGKPARFSQVGLVRGHKLKFIALHPKSLPYLEAHQLEIDLAHDAQIGLTGRAAVTGQSQLVGDVSTVSEYREFDPDTRSELAVPIQVGAQVIGVINVEHPETDAFDEDDREDLEALAAWAAIAIQNARQFDLRARLLKAAEMTATEGVLQHVLATVAAGVLETMDCDLVSVYAHNPDTKEISYPSVIAGNLLHTEGQAQWDLVTAEKRLPIERLHANSVLKALLREGISRFAEDAATDSVLSVGGFVARERIASAAAMVLKVGAQVVGFLFANYRTRHEFTPAEKQAIELFAAQAALVVENARAFAELKRTKGVVGARTALAWMGMVSNAWRHAIDKHAQTIKLQAGLLQRDLQKMLGSADYHAAMARLDTVQRLAKEIEEKPMIPPLSAEEGRSRIPVNDWIRERARQLWRNDPYRQAELCYDLHASQGDVVFVCPEWFRRAFDILVDNAVDAVAGLAVRRITLGTRLTDGQVEILVSDTGKGIPPEVASRLFSQQVPKTEATKGLGIGLLIAQAIVETYGGEIKIGSTEETGTTMVMRFPLAR